MKPSRMFNTDTDGESIYAIISAAVMMNVRVKFHDKYDCTMDIYYNFMTTEKRGKRVQRPNKEVNVSYVKKMTNDRIKDWNGRAHRRLEHAAEITDTNFPIPIDEEPNFLWVHEQSEVHSAISRDIIDEYNELFDKTVKALAKEHNTTESAMKKRRSRFLARARLEVAELNPQLYKDIKRPGTHSE